MHCVATVGASLTPADLADLSYQGAKKQAFLAAVFDTCLTDQHKETYFHVDIVGEYTIGFDDDSARCLAPGMVTLVDTFGFAAVFAQPTAAVKLAFETARLRCGMIGPGRQGEAAYFAGVRNGKLDLLRKAFCPGLFTDGQISAWAERVTAVNPIERASVFRLESAVNAVPEVWIGFVKGRRVEVSITAGTAGSAMCIAAIAVVPADPSGLLLPA